MAKTDLKNISSRIDIIMQMMSLKNSSSDIQTNLDRIIDQLSEVDYIPYPVSLSTVDIIALNRKYTKVLLGRKPGQTHYQFPGGFRDPEETNQMACAREFHEEAGMIIPINKFQHLSSNFIDDNRYKNSCHKITTDISIVLIKEKEINNAVAGDDLEEVKLFSIDELILNKENIIRNIHIPIFNTLLKFLNK